MGRHTVIAESKAAKAAYPLGKKSEPKLLGEEYSAQEYAIDRNNTVAFSVYRNKLKSAAERDARKMYQRVYFRDFTRSGDAEEEGTLWTFKFEGSSQCWYAEFEVYYVGYVYTMHGTPSINASQAALLDEKILMNLFGTHQGMKKLHAMICLEF